MPAYQSITSTPEFIDALKQLQTDIPKYIRVNGLRSKISVQLPNPLVRLIVWRGDYAYESVQKKITGALSQFCEIGEWTKYKNERGDDCIQFKLIPERVKDEV